MAILVACAASCSGSRPASTSEPAGVANILADIEAHRVVPGDRLRVTGVVTDDDAERRLVFVADASRGIAVRTGADGLKVPIGHRVTIEARLD